MFKNFFQNTRRPKGFTGKIMVQVMNRGHARLAKWGLSHITLKGKIDALDIGCGGGANLASLLTMFPSGTAAGMDYSAVSVAQSTRLNQAEISKGRCRVLQGNVSDLPFPKNSFDLITAFETIYFWPDLPSSFRQIHGVLRPGGAFLICNEMSDPSDDKWTKLIEGMRVYGRPELEQLLTDAGFSRIDTDEKNGCICLIAEKKP